MLQYNHIISQKDKENANLKKKYNDISTKYIEVVIGLEEKNKEIKKLKERMNEMQKMSTPTVEKITTISIQPETLIASNSEGTVRLTESVEIDNGKNQIITNINKENIDDLEAIYFYDRVHMRSSSEHMFKVPKLNLGLAIEKLNSLQQQAKKNEEAIKKKFNSPNNNKNKQLEPQKKSQILFNTTDKKNNKLANSLVSKAK